MKLRISFTLILALLWIFPHNANSATIYSVNSLKFLCSSNGGDEGACHSYVQGVVETWMLKDMQSFEPTRYQSRDGLPTFCETIIKVSEDEWIRIIRDSLPTMQPGLASPAVQDALAERLCK